jgi:hypothetical protein
MIKAKLIYGTFFAWGGDLRIRLCFEESLKGYGAHQDLADVWTQSSLVHTVH